MCCPSAHLSRAPSDRLRRPGLSQARPRPSLACPIRPAPPASFPTGKHSSGYHPIISALNARQPHPSNACMPTQRALSRRRPAGALAKEVGKVARRASRMGPAQDGHSRFREDGSDGAIPPPPHNIIPADTLRPRHVRPGLPASPVLQHRPAQRRLLRRRRCAATFES